MDWGVIVRSATGDIVYANQAAMRIYGVSGMVELAAADLDAAAFAHDGQPLAERPSAKALRTLEPVRDVVVGRRRADGAIQWRLIDAGPIPGAHGETKQVVWSFIDRTAGREAQG